MTSPSAPASNSGLLQAALDKVKSAPLSVGGVVKELQKGKKGKAKDEITEDAVTAALEEGVRQGSVFKYASGKQEDIRYWSQDEGLLLRERAIEVAATPQKPADVKKALTQVSKGVDGKFVDKVVGELVHEKRLFEHGEGKNKLLGVTPPKLPPPLEQPNHKRALDKLVADCDKLMKAASVKAEEVLAVLQKRLGVVLSPPLAAPKQQQPASPPLPEPVADPRELERLILDAVSGTLALSLKDLRHRLPSRYRGKAFDEAVLRLMDEEKVVCSQDTDVSRFSASERAEYVQDGEAIFTVISPRS